jgi:vacuolar protein sorting-associated protein 35
LFFILLQGACVKKLSSKPKLEDHRAKKQVVALLSAPLEKYKDVVMALTLSNYPRVMDHLDDETNKVMAMVIIQSIMKNYTCITAADQVGFFSVCCTILTFLIGGVWLICSL